MLRYGSDVGSQPGAVLQVFSLSHYVGCLLLRTALLTCVIVCSSATTSGHSPRRPDMLFSNSTKLLGRTVTCDSERPDNSVVFPSDTWSCYNLKVDGLRVRYWYIPGFGAERACSDGRKFYDNRNDISALCREMMKAHNIHKELWTTYVNDGSCSESPDERVIFTINNGAYRWETFSTGKGYIKTLRCMTID